MWNKPCRTDPSLGEGGGVGSQGEFLKRVPTFQRRAFPEAHKMLEARGHTAQLL